jgi:hypothetical protein
MPDRPFLGPASAKEAAQHARYEPGWAQIAIGERPVEMLLASLGPRPSRWSPAGTRRAGGGAAEKLSPRRVVESPCTSQR